MCIRDRFRAGDSTIPARLELLNEQMDILQKQKEHVLDAPYYHVVFTGPEELNSIIYSNQKLLYDALYHACLLYTS